MNQLSTANIVIIIVGVLVALGLISVLIMKYRRDTSRGNQLPWEERKPLEQHPIEDAEIVSDIPDDARDLTGSDITLEQPESVPSRMQRLRARLARSGALGNALLSILSRAAMLSLYSFS